MVSAISSSGSNALALQAQRASTTLDNQLARHQRKLSDLASSPAAGSTQSKVQIAQIGGQISTVKQQLSQVRKAPPVEQAQPPNAAQPTYSSHGVLKSPPLGAKLNVVA